jgi:RNA polymerase sigma factor (sigma-70 family)
LLVAVRLRCVTMRADPALPDYAEPDLATRAGFEAAAALCYDRVVRAVFLATGDAAGAEDAVQEALAKAWLRRRTVHSLPAYLTKVALNHATSSWRRRSRESSTDPHLLESHDAGGNHNGATHGMASDLRAALLQLPQRQREAIVLHDYLNFSFEEAAQVLGATPEALRNAAFHARRSLRRQIPQHGRGSADV